MLTVQLIVGMCMSQYLIIKVLGQKKKERQHKSQGKAKVKESKGSVQTPKSVDFVESIPLSAVGKPDKKALRARYWGDRTRAVN